MTMPDVRLYSLSSRQWCAAARLWTRGVWQIFGRGGILAHDFQTHTRKKQDSQAFDADAIGIEAVSNWS
jgi:hypothetical protein